MIFRKISAKDDQQTWDVDEFPCTISTGDNRTDQHAGYSNQTN